MKIIFLDIDGVLNNLDSLRAGSCSMGVGWWDGDPSREGSGFEPNSVQELKRILSATDAKIVISSTWRKLGSIETLREVFENWDISPDLILGATPITDRGHRGTEIRHWLQSFTRNGKVVDKWIAIDDDSDFHDDQILIQTSFETGLTSDIADAAIAALT